MIDGPLHNIRRTRTLPATSRPITDRCWPPPPGSRFPICSQTSAPDCLPCATTFTVANCASVCRDHGPGRGPVSCGWRCRPGSGLPWRQETGGCRIELAAGIRLRPPSRPACPRQHGTGRRPGTSSAPAAGRLAPGAARRAGRGAGNSTAEWLARYDEPRMSDDLMRIGLVDGSVDSNSRTFHVVLDAAMVIQLDELIGRFHRAAGR